MKKYSKEELAEILDLHKKRINNEEGGGRADLSGANLRGANLRGANLSEADLSEADLSGANLSEADLSGANLSGANLFNANLFNADLSGANLRGANLSEANLSKANLFNANLSGANLSEADLSEADLRGANLSKANLFNANLSKANLFNANLSGANLSEANLSGIVGLKRVINVQPGQIFWKRFCSGLNNGGYQFYLGLNELRPGEIFASDERVSCSYPGFHFASREWCTKNYGNRPLEAKIRIPEDAKINEPWATDGKASADKIEILEIFDAETEKDVSEQFRREGE